MQPRTLPACGTMTMGLLTALLLVLSGCAGVELPAPEELATGEIAGSRPAVDESGETQREQAPQPAPQPPLDPLPPSSPSPPPPPPPASTPTPGIGLPPGDLTIVALGDSLTEGTGDELGGGFPARLLKRVQAVRPGSTMLNLGRYGWTSGELIDGTDTEPSQLAAGVASRPDVACVWIGSNDLWRLYEYGPESGTSRADEDADLSAYAANIDTIVKGLTDAGATVVIALLDDQSQRPVSADRATLPNTTPAEFVQMSAQVARYNDVIRTSAQRYGALLVDFSQTTIFTSEDTLDYDGIHPNTTGYDRIAEMWFAAVETGLN